MKRVCIIILLLVVSSNIILSQTSDKIIQELKSKNIKTREDLLKEFEKQNISEDQARQYASLYGVNYDDFVNKYLNQSSQSSFFESISKYSNQTSQPLAPDTLNKTETRIDTVTKETTFPVSKPVITDSRGLNYFGYDIFQKIPSAFEPAEIGPVDPSYVLGPGDVLRLYLWGDVELQYELTVDRTGNIFIPTAGQFFVLGVSYENLREKLINYLSKYYAGLNTSPPSVFLDISLTKLRPVKIFAVGEVSNPGNYNISSYSSVINALYSFGGPTLKGSLREIRIIRENKVASTVDLYEFLLNGVMSSDTRLQNNDMIFIPPKIKSVSIAGEVLREGVYELKEGEKLRNLINFAGGLKSTAYIGRVQIKRIIPFNQRVQFEPEMTLIDLSLDKIISGEQNDIELFDSDEVTVFPIVPRMETQVEIEGAVYRPGVYDVKKTPVLSKLIEEAYGLLPEASLEKADLFRTRPDKTFEYISLDLRQVLKDKSKFDFELKPLDKIRIYSVYEIQSNLNVSISGFVKSEITIPYTDSLTVYDLLIQAGGLQDTTFLGKVFSLRGDIIRLNPDGYTSMIVPFNLSEVLTKKEMSSIDIKSGDRIFIYKADVDKELIKSVRIGGEVRNPGQYELYTNMTPMDLILLAGGFTERALRDFVYVNRLDPQGYSGDKLSENLVVNLPEQFNFDRSSSLFLLQNLDIVIVRRNPDFEKQRIVKISGEITYPGMYVLNQKNETILDLIKTAGGPTTESFLFGTQFHRNEKRVILDLDKLYRNGDEDENIYLQDNDSIYIPRRPNSVLVGGEVNSPGIFKYIPGLDVKDYVDRAGGLTDSSDYAVYTQPTGISQRVNFGWFSSNPEVFDGSIIFVRKLLPPSPSDNFDLGGFLKDIFAISASVLTIIVLVTKLN
ncbi:MAG TPA: SLBB domain-containing protein [Melioribacteraceae bacterium]|nr:SLBB domain-containing protein [Melioribacteraceae bacterium]